MTCIMHSYKHHNVIKQNLAFKGERLSVCQNIFFEKMILKLFEGELANFSLTSYMFNSKTL